MDPKLFALAEPNLKPIIIYQANFKPKTDPRSGSSLSDNYDPYTESCRSAEVLFLKVGNCIFATFVSPH
jgi:hypothetical protein